MGERAHPLPWTPSPGLVRLEGRADSTPVGRGGAGQTPSSKQKPLWSSVIPAQKAYRGAGAKPWKASAHSQSPGEPGMAVTRQGSIQ